MKFTMLLALALIVSCGKRDGNDNTTNECRSRERMRIVCVNERTPNYGYGYSVDSCNKEYSYDRCY
jgi:hypothetical protein